MRHGITPIAKYFALFGKFPFCSERTSFQHSLPDFCETGLARRSVEIASLDAAQHSVVMYFQHHSAVS